MKQVTLFKAKSAMLVRNFWYDEKIDIIDNIRRINITEIGWRNIDNIDNSDNIDICSKKYIFDTFDNINLLDISDFLWV